MRTTFLILSVLSTFSGLLSLPAVAQNSSPYWSLEGNNNATGTSKLGTTTSTPLRLFTNNTERIRISGNGNVGIGTITPVNKLTIKLSGSTPAASWLSGSSALPAFIAFGEDMTTGFNLATAANASGYRPVLNTRKSRGTLAAPATVLNNDYLASYVSSGYDGSNFQNPASIDFYVDGIPSAGNVPARISFVTGTNAGNRLERLKILSTGDVSIGAGNLIMESAEKTIQFATPTAASAPMITLFPSGTANAERMVIGHSPSFPNWGLQYQDNTDKFNFLSGGVPVLTADLSARNVGIGTSSPVNKLHIRQSVANRAIQWQHEAYSDYWTVGIGTNTLNCRFEFNGLLRGSISSVDGSFLSGSDRRLKEEIELLPAVMDKVMQLKPSKYFITDSHKFAKNKSLGFIAQDVEPFFPEMVYDFDGGYKGLNYSAFAVVAIKAIQEQQQGIQQQQESISDQQKTINSLLDRISKLESTLNAITGNSTTDLAGAVLDQNSPNPFKQSTTFRYKIPEGAKGRINIYDIAGRLVKSIGAPTGGQVQLSGNELPAGTYSYRLYINGKAAASKKMVVLK